MKDMVPVYSRAGIAIARSGATTLSELACAGIPSILVPYPESSDGHQLRNAECFAKRHASLVVQQASDVLETTKQLEAALTSLIGDFAKREAMSRVARAWARRDAADRIAREVLEVADLAKEMA
jgi:UDP-N-acetylglucosamine--N-acetylmuramyl-(pentapeptide) pyrophosphoryl-undecaprenol N-acetylglucosamine transferase